MLIATCRPGPFPALPCGARAAYAGTPIQNDLSEFHAVFDLACPGLLGDLTAFRKTYEGPILRGRDADATEKQVLRRLLREGTGATKGSPSITRLTPLHCMRA